MEFYLKHFIRKTTRFGRPVEVKKRVMVALWKMASNIDFRSLGHLFGIGKATACIIFHEVVSAICDHLGPLYLRFPNDNELRGVVDGFSQRWNLPQCCGAIDGTHIPIVAPAENHTDYFNRKQFHSVIMQAVVNHDYRFLNISVGHCGKHHDGYVLQHSALFDKATSGQLIPDWYQEINGVNVPLYFVGDPAYPLLPWLMKGFPTTGLTEAQKYFNYRQSRARMVVECAFGRLKGRWRFILKRLDHHITSVPRSVKASCIVHNICEVHGEYFNDLWLEEVQRLDRQPLIRQPLRENRGIAQATAVRQALCDWVNQNRI